MMRGSRDSKAGEGRCKNKGGRRKDGSSWGERSGIAGVGDECWL